METPDITFDDKTIQTIFGHEAAENENKERLRNYYFKGPVYERITADLPLRILVGHKGTGKSALFSVAQQEDAESGILSVLIRPDDVVEIGRGSTDFLAQVADWKKGLLRIIYAKIFSRLGVGEDDLEDRVFSYTGKFVQFVADTLQPFISKIADLDRSKGLLTSTFLIKKEVHVYLDDLDRGWKADIAGIERMSSLLNALRDLANEHQGLSFRVALRSDVYFLVRTADESTDKIESSVVWQSWTNHEILAMLVKRVESFLGREHREEDLMRLKQSELAKMLDPIMVSVFNGKGHWHNAPTYRVLMSLIRKRPRDLVKLCTLAAQEARINHHPRIYTQDLIDVFERYSQERLQDCVNEYRSELPEVERLLLSMKPNKKELQAGKGFVFSTDELLAKLGLVERAGRFRFAGGKLAEPRVLAQFLYKINFLTARRELDSGEILRRYFEENKYLSSGLVDFGFSWEVHPAYRWALQPDDIDSLFSKIALSAD